MRILRRKVEPERPHWARDPSAGDKRYPGYFYVDEPLRDAAFEPPAERIGFLDVEVARVDFSGRRYPSVHSQGTRFVDCDFSGASFREDGFGSWLGGLFLRCDFDRADLRNVALGHVRFESCTFRETRTSIWLADDADFVDCVFSGDRMRGAVFHGAGEGREFRGNDFTGAALRNTGFHSGIDLDSQRLPTGPEFIRLDGIDQRILRVREALDAWPEDERRLGRAFLAGIVLPDDGQDDLFMRRDEAYASFGAELTERLLALLENAA